MKARLAVAALNNAVARRAATGSRGDRLHRSRRPRVAISITQVPPRACSPWPARLDGPGRLRRRQRRHGVFFSLLQKNVLDRQPWRTHQQLRIAIVTWIERTYHRRRRQAELGRLTPIEFEAIMTRTATQAA